MNDKQKAALADRLTLYIKAKHTVDECSGFADGFAAAFDEMRRMPVDEVKDVDDVKNTIKNPCITCRFLKTNEGGYSKVYYCSNPNFSSPIINNAQGETCSRFIAKDDNQFIKAFTQSCYNCKYLVRDENMNKCVSREYTTVISRDINIFSCDKFKKKNIK